MFKKSITYTDYDGNERTEDFFFNLNKAELIEFNYFVDEGMEKFLQQIVKKEDIKSMIGLIKELIRRAYGEKSSDGLRFIKYRDGRSLADDFMQTEAYSELFVELTSDEKKVSDFINGIIPRKMAEEIAEKKNK